MKTLLLTPNDFLFFRDSRPMSGALSGHGAHLPAPHVFHNALHAACHRAFHGQPEVGYRHGFARKKKIDQHSRKEWISEDSERFGSLRSVGPFPVDEGGKWFFPKPADLNHPSNGIAVKPLPDNLPGHSSLLPGLQPLAPLQPPSKDAFPTWMNKIAFECYLRGEAVSTKDTGFDHDFFLPEHQLGIGMDPQTGTTETGRIYTREQLRLKEGYRLGTFVESGNRFDAETDLMDRLFPENGYIQVGGENRFCSVELHSSTPAEALPLGPSLSGTRVKWVLLSPAVFPFIQRDENSVHPGGWLPNWIDPGSYKVQLLDGPGSRKAKRTGHNPGQPIRAKLIAARIERKLPISGWTNPGSEVSADRKSGARSTLFAVPAGSVYYFEADIPEQAQKLAEALNWYGKTEGKKIVNRRSTLFGEKGFGLGVCASF
ncbi:MAG: type III-B CRISPR module-associated Cmr3 family protein [Puniceicoccales bacterium]